MVLRQQTFVLKFMGDADGRLGVLRGEIVFAETLWEEQTFSKMMLQKEVCLRWTLGRSLPIRILLSTSTAFGL